MGKIIDYHVSRNQLSVIGEVVMGSTRTLGTASPRHAPPGTTLIIAMYPRAQIAYTRHSAAFIRLRKAVGSRIAHLLCWSSICFPSRLRSASSSEALCVWSCGKTGIHRTGCSRTTDKCISLPEHRDRPAPRSCWLSDESKTGNDAGRFWWGIHTPDREIARMPPGIVSPAHLIMENDHVWR